MSLGLPAVFMLCLDAWSGDLVMLLSGYIGVDVQAAQIVLGNIVYMLYMVGFGLEKAACVIVGQQIGKGDAPEALRYYNTIRIVSAIMIILVIIIQFIYRKELIYMFTDIDSI